MPIRYLLLLVLGLSLSVWLALTNPSMDDYLAFVEAELGQALDRYESKEPNKERTMLRAIFRSHSRELVASIVRPHTLRRNWGLLSRYETSALDVHIEVIGVAGRFIPLKGVDDAIVRLGRHAF